MFTRPGGFPDSLLADVVRSGWGPEPVAVEYLPVGFGSHHWRVDGGGDAWFVTVDDLQTRLQSTGDSLRGAFARLRAAIGTARAAYEGGASFVVAPVPTVDGDVVRRVGDQYAAAVYPYVVGRRHSFGDVLGASDRRLLLELIVALHGTPETILAGALVDDLETRTRRPCALDLRTGVLVYG